MRPQDGPFARVPLAAEEDRIWGGARQKQGAEAAVGEKLTGS